MIRLINIVLLMCCPAIVLAQSVDEVLDRMRANYTDADQLEFKATYQLFKGHTSNEAHTTYQGYCLRDNDRAYQKIDETFFVYTPQFSLKVNRGEKAMVLSPPATELILADVDINALNHECKSKRVEVADGYYTVLLYVKDESTIPISLVKLKINRKNDQLMRMDIYYTDHIDFSETYKQVDYQPPHVRITFNEMNTHPRVNDRLFSLETYVKKTKTGYIPTDSYAEYEIGDYTK